MLGFILFGACRSFANWQYKKLPLAALHSGSLYCIVFLLHVFASGCADVPLSMAIVTAISASMLAEKKQTPIFWYIACVAAASAVFIKNEGVFFTFFYFIFHVQNPAFRKHWRVAIVSLLVFGVLIGITKGYNPPANDVWELATAWRNKILDISRYLFIAKQISLILVTTFPYFLVLCAITIYGLLRHGWHTPSRYWGALFACFLAYCAVYLITPYGLAWHIASSFSRLFLQLFPAFLLLFWVDLQRIFTKE